MISVDFSIPLAAIGVAAVSWKSILDWKNSKKMHMVTKSDWLKINSEIQKLRDDSDKHQTILTELETGFKFIQSMLEKIDNTTGKLESKKNDRYTFHEALEGKILELKAELKGIKRAMESKRNS